MSGGAGNVYAPTRAAQAGVDQSYGYGLNSTTPYIGQANNLVQQYTNNPYQGQAQAGANTAGAYATGTVSPGAMAGAEALNGVGGQFAPAVGQALATGFSPNNALYDQQLQRTMDQANVINSMNGVAQTPYAAGLVNEAVRNFNNNWNVQQAGIQNTAANTAATLGGAARDAYGGAYDLGTGAYGTYAGGSALPAQTYSDNLASSLQAITGGVGINSAVLGDILQYLSYGTNAATSQENVRNANSPLAAIGTILGGIDFGKRLSGGSK